MGYDTRTRANRNSIGIGVFNFLVPFGYFELDSVVLTNMEVTLIEQDLVFIGGRLCLFCIHRDI